MKYIDKSHINKVRDVELFFQYLVEERKLNFHPDEDFINYVSYSSGERTFTDEECQLYNRLMDECFDVCKKAGVDIYEVGISTFN
ncbi:MAG: hypothetical protein ACI4A7_02780 [Prevotella sp.]